MIAGSFSIKLLGLILSMTLIQSGIKLNYIRTHKTLLLFFDYAYDRISVAVNMEHSL